MALSAFVPGKGPKRQPEEPLRRNNRPAHTPLPGAEHVTHKMLDESEHLRPAPPPHEPSAPNYRPSATQADE